MRTIWCNPICAIRWNPICIICFGVGYVQVAGIDCMLQSLLHFRHVLQSHSYDGIPFAIYLVCCNPIWMVYIGVGYAYQGWWDCSPGSAYIVYKICFGVRYNTIIHASSCEKPEKKSGNSPTETWLHSPSLQSEACVLIVLHFVSVGTPTPNKKT